MNQPFSLTVDPGVHRPARGQMSIEFFLIAGFILLAASVLISNSDIQIQETAALSNVVAGRNAMDLMISNARYVYYSGNNSVITHITFIPANTTCFNYNASNGRLYCLTSGLTGLVYSDAVPFPMTSVLGNQCADNGWLRIRTQNQNSVIVYNCTRV
ncbi:hypothetical protein KJ765_00110 [Candidatus Micrarchaeota archaeon]|nr:hypothetical protein [Candidatus Micrarchaeota archaeon]